MIYSISHFTLVDWSFVCGAKPTKAPRGHRTGYQQPSISKNVLANHARWDIGFLEAQ